MPDLWSVGHLTVDDEVWPDGTTRMGTCGGAAVYAALGARIVGGSAGLISRRGAGYPQNALDGLRRRGVDLALVDVDRSAISQWVIYERDGSRTYLPHPESSSYDAMSPVPNDTQLSADARLHVAPMPVSRQRAWIHSRRPTGPVTLDPHHDSCRDAPEEVLALLPGLSAFLPSELEATYLAGADPARAVRTFLADGATTAAVKLGAAGSVVGTGEQVWQVGAVDVSVVDATGAGDAYCGGFAAALARGCSALEAAQYGTVAASFVVECTGTQFDIAAITASDVTDRLDSLSVTPIAVEEHPASITSRDRPRRERV